MASAVDVDYFVTPVNRTLCDRYIRVSFFISLSSWWFSISINLEIKYRELGQFKRKLLPLMCPPALSPQLDKLFNVKRCSQNTPIFEALL